jgi:hypothetical protein
MWGHSLTVQRRFWKPVSFAITFSRRTQMYFADTKRETAMKQYAFASFAAMICAAGIFAGSGKIPDFSGNWSLNSDKSSMGTTGYRWAASKLMVEQAANRLSIKRFIQKPDGQGMAFIDTLALDGKDCDNSIADSKKFVRGEWAKDSSSLIITMKTAYVRKGESREIITTEIWKLADKGKKLSIDFATRSAQKERQETYSYYKVKKEK